VIYVRVVGRDPDGGQAGGNGWHDTLTVMQAVAVELERFHDHWATLDYGPIAEYTITVATEASPRRTAGRGWPLPSPLSRSR